MALQLRLIHCVIDEEPKSFHSSARADEINSFAINLSVECAPDLTMAIDIEGDETAAEESFDTFLNAAQKVQFHVWKVKSPAPPTFEYVGRVFERVSEAAPLGNIDDLMAWLRGHVPTSTALPTRYWSTALASDVGGETQTSIEAAGATHRLRAVQSWNAPVGHKFWLTHVIRLDVDLLAADYLVLPYFDDPGDTPDVPTPKPEGDQHVWEVEYDSLGDVGKIACRTPLLGGTAMTKPLDPAEVDPIFTADGYLVVDPNTEDLWRLTRWFESRAASLMSAAPALAPRSKEDAEVAYEKIFGTVFKGDGTVEPTAAWLAAAGLTAALDDFILGLIKPVTGAEGELLAPLISAVLSQLDGLRADLADKKNAFDAATVTTAVRRVLDKSALITPNGVKPDIDIIAALRRVHGLSAPAADAAIEIKVLDAVLGFYEDSTKTPGKALKDSIAPGDELTVLTRALAEADERLQSESGAEAALVRLIETSTILGGGSVPSLIAQAYVDALDPPGDAVLQSHVRQAVEEAWTVYRTLLEGPFNAAEAVRRAAGSEFTQVVLGASPVVGKTPPQRFVEVVTLADFYSARFFADAPSEFEKLIKWLANPTFSGSADERIKIKAHLKAAYSDAVDPLASLLTKSVRFIPDDAPHPLPLQIAANIDGAKVDEFAKHFNGIAVAVRRIDTGDDTIDLWAHANLADLRWDAPPQDIPLPEKTAKAAIQPMLPAISDGRAPMFIEYQGFPFASAAFAGTTLDDSAADKRYSPFYRADAANYSGSLFAPVPRLAYGRKFECFAFLTSNAGTLPLDLQASSQRPWMPASAIVAPQAADATLIAEADYRRRTAIGQMAINQRDVRAIHKGAIATATKQRIGAPVEGVRPFSTDYPRIGLFAVQRAAGVRDIFREFDGRGTLDIASPIATEVSNQWQLTEIRWAGKPERLTLRLFDGPPEGPDTVGLIDLPFESSDFDLSTVGKIVINITATRGPAAGGEPLTGTAEITCGNTKRQDFTATGESLWLRLVLESDDQACMTFADPGSQKPDGVDAPLLLLAPKNVDVWNEGLPYSLTAEVTTPRVGYLDFERWFANEDLRDTTFSDDASAAKLMDALLAAYVMRHLDEELAAALDRLPDPAVSRVRVEHAALDRFDGPLSAVGLVFDLAGRLGEVAAGITRTEGWTPELLKKEVFTPIDKKFKFAVESVSEGTELTLTKSTAGLFRAVVPAGTAARLSMDVLVPSEHFQSNGLHPAVFHEGFKQYATRELEDFLAFPSAAMRVETMLDAMGALNAIQLAADMIEAKPIKKARRYDILTKARPAGANPEEQERHWRLLAEIDVTTQRWRPTGRPIYHFVNPKAYRADGLTDAVIDPALVLTLDGDGHLASFEEEAFFDRPNIDSQTVTQTLLPLPSSTVLQQHFWDSPSATYFRHRFTLRSRYAGALRRRADREATAWITDTKDLTLAHAWSMRVAMMADLSRILLTRPQLRSLIPLTTAPGAHETRRPAPPVLAILQEPPYARGGLADRVAAEIKTGFGYGFAAPVAEAKDERRVEVMDARKEIGPTPYLDYRAFDQEASLGMTLVAEGPIGLTFDAVNSPAPAFPNSMLVLSPISVSGHDRLLEEHLLGVSMRRHVDPEWTTDESAFATEFDPERCWWIKFDLPNFSADDETRDLIRYRIEGAADPLSLLSIRLDKKILVIRVETAAVDGITGTDEKFVDVARLELEFAGIAVLHQVIAPGRYSAAIFALPRFDLALSKRGRSSAPLMLASFEWSAPLNTVTQAKPRPKVVSLVAGQVVPLFEASVRATMSSAPTFLAWTRTGRDFEFVPTVSFNSTAVDLEEQWETDAARVTQVVAALSSRHDTISFNRSGAFRSIWAVPSTFLSPYPLNAHRHLAVLTTRYLHEPGRPIETFCRSGVVLGTKPVLIDRFHPSATEIYRPPEECVRFVEFETGASILCGTGGTIPKVYDRGYFDLLSSGFRKDNRPGALRLLFRFVGLPPHLRAFKKLKIAIWPSKPLPPGSEPTGEIPEEAYQIGVDLKNTVDHFTTGVELRLPMSDPITLSLLRSDGVPLELDNEGYSIKGERFVPVVPDHMNPGFFMKIVAEGGTGEFWCDVSLLHSSAEQFFPLFDFDWLFSAIRSGLEPSQEVSPQSLMGRPDTQARIVSVSPPIPIVSHG